MEHLHNSESEISCVLASNYSMSDSEGKKVNEFLDTLDKFSQERLKEEQKRKWQLERDIDQLSQSDKSRSSSPSSSKRPSLSSRASSAGKDIKEIVFNRTASARTKFQEKWRNKGPELPPRPESRALDSGELSDEEAPQLPSRPGGLSLDRAQGRRNQGIDLPVRRSKSPEAPPLLPKRPSAHEEDEEIDIPLSFGLAKPVARKTPPAKPTSKPKLAADTPEIEKPKSKPEFMTPRGTFTAMESKIRDKGVGEAVNRLKKFEKEEEDPKLNALKPTKPEKPLKPLVAPKPGLLAQLSKAEIGNDSKEKDLSKPEAPKPRAASTKASPAVSNTSTPRPSIPTPSTLASKQLASKAAPIKPPIKSPKPTIEAYKDKDSEELKNQILRLSPTKPKEAPIKPAKKDFDNEQKELLKSQLLKLSQKKTPPAKPSPLKIKPSIDKPSGDDPEAISALHSLKPAKPAALKAPPKPEALQKFCTIRDHDDSKVALSVKNSFQAELSGVLRSSTEPSLGRSQFSSGSSSSLTETSKAEPPKASIRRVQTEPSADKIEHVTKSRAKGPRRRLPKYLNEKASSQVKIQPKEIMKESEAELKDGKDTSDGASSNEASFKETSEKPTKVPPKKPAKKPPPIKAKKPDILVKPRNVSGELFI